MKHLLIFLPLLIALPTSAQRVREHLKPEQHANSGSARGSAPANDDCANAQAITVTADCSAPVSGTNAEATQDGPTPGCDEAGTFLDVWYVFNPGNTDTVSVSLIPADANAQDWNLGVYTACDGNETACLINPAAQVNVPVIPNTDNWIRVWANTSFAPGGDFTLCVADQVNSSAPANDLCTNAAVQAVPIAGSATFTGNCTGATDSEGLGFPSVWEAFTLNECADVKISFCGTAPKILDFWLLLYTACTGGDSFHSGSYDSTACADGNFTLCYANLAPGTYYYPIAATFNNPAAYTMHVSATACGTDEAPNDECPGAIPLTAHPTCTPEFFTNTCATQSMPAVNCGGFTGIANDDVWYRFVATSTEMTVGGAPHGNMDIVMELFSGNCDALNSIACGDVGGEGVADDMIATGLTVGDTYYFRAYDFRAQYAYGDPGYDLCVVDGQGSGVGVEENASRPNNLFPNPNDGEFTIMTQPGARVTMRIVDATGRTVLSRMLNADASGAVRLHEAHHLTAGAYQLVLDAPKGTTTHRLIIH
ncbi:MAG: T9SS type A sorting domain-containing protein [Bacteroidetes bacterium]|nr:T9SS type A sorting domain-containing protein [Bacteroidota bacterium]MBS1941072.1 T9SS type A sorting domain-containing protein [Bacteroidota bacterium]